MKRLKKVAHPVGLVGHVLNMFSNSKKDSYSCDYINEALKDNYSTEEQRIGTWMGKPLYRKVVSGAFGTVTQDVESTLEIPIANADFALTKYFWVDRRPTENYINQGPVSGSIDYSYTSFSSTQALIRFRSKASWVSDKTLYAIVEYTKTTD